MTDVNVLVLNNQADIRTPEDLLARVLPQMVEAVEGAINAQVYRLSRGELVVWQNVNMPETNGTFYVLKDDSLFQQAIEQKELVVDDGSHRAIAPMLADGDVFALLVVEFESVIIDEPLVKFAADLSLVLHNRQLHRLLQRQMSAMSLLNEAKTLTDVTRIIAHAMAEPEQYLGMNVLEYDAEGQVKSVRVIATANRNHSYAVDIEMPLDQETRQNLYDLLVSDGDILITDVATEERFSVQGREWLMAQKACSAYLVAMSGEGQTSAFLSLIDTKHALAPSDIEMLLFQSVAHQAAVVVENQQLLERTRQSAERAGEQARVMHLLNELIAKINPEQDETRILQFTVEALLEATQADHTGIVLYQNNRGFVVSEAPNHGVVGVEVEAGADGVNAVLSKQRRALVIADLENDTILPEKSRAVLKQVGTKSIVLLPMFDLNNRLLGSVGMDYYTKQEEIPRSVLDIAQAIVAQVTLSLQRVRLLAQSQQQAKQLQHITDFGQKLRAYLGVEEIVTTALHVSQDLLELDYVTIMLYDRPSDSLRCVGEMRDGEIEINLPGKVVNAEADMIAAQSWKKREMMYIDDLHADWEWKHPLEQQLQTLIAQPLSSAGVVLGIMEVGHHLPSAYNTVDITTFQQMSNQLAIALSNAEAYAQSQKLARNKTLANDIITKMQQQSNMTNILEVTIHELGQALGAKRGRIRLGTIKASGDKS